MASESVLSAVTNGVPQKMNGLLQVNGVPPLGNASPDSHQSPLTKSTLMNGYGASEISELATRISTNTARLNDYLQQNHLPLPSFDEDAPVDLGLSPEIEEARVATVEASAQLQDLLRGPVELLRPTVGSF